MAMKFERHNDCENVQLEVLSDDWTKFIMLQADRSVEFHTPLGMHYRTRVPKFGRDMSYHYPSCDLLIGASGNEVYRLNLEQGRFLNPLLTESPGINVTAINPAHQMWCFGGEDGCVEFWDHRERSRIGRLNITAAVGNSKRMEISAIRFADDGLNYAVGTSDGHVAVYDLRSPVPRLVKDHQYSSPIKAINFHSSGNVVSADQKIIKIWDRNSVSIL
jgi:ribosome biogenesis protein ENP2